MQRNYLPLNTYMSLKILILLTLLISCFKATAETPTEYIWMKSKKSLFKGSCIEVDSETKGKKFNSPVKAHFCKTDQTAFYFLPDEGKCFEIDEPSKGENFIVKTDIENCQPEKTIKKFTKILGREGCFEIDASGDWKKYYRSLNANKCDNQNTLYSFVLKEKHQGECYAKSAAGAVLVKVIFCKPENVIYKFYRLKSFSGECFEQDPRGEKYYSKRTKLQNCRPEETIFVFYNDKENIKQSSCYELDAPTKGNEYLAKVNRDKCK